VGFVKAAARLCNGIKNVTMWILVLLYERSDCTMIVSPQHAPHNAAGVPQPWGLYDAAYEHDSCGVGFVAQLDGTATHALID
jgi:hypothetical protein